MKPMMSVSRHLKNSVQGMAHYQARWFNPEFKGRREYRLVIAAREQHAALMSASFGGNVLVLKSLRCSEGLVLRLGVIIFRLFK
jgi:hypothetical protein